MRILYCITSLNPGGAPRRCVQLANEAARLGHEVWLAQAYDSPTPVMAVAPEVNLVRLRCRGWFVKHGARQLYDLLRQVRPEIYHGFLNTGTYYGIPLARAARVPVVLGASMSMPNPRFLGHPYAAATLTAFLLAHAVTTNSRRSHEAYPRQWFFPRRRLHLIPNFVDVRAFAARTPEIRAAVRRELGLADDTLAVLTTARLTRAKAHADLLAGFAAVAEQCPSVQLFFAGDGELREPLQRQVASTGLTDRVHFLGSQSNIPRLTQGFDLFCLPSHREGMPNALLEAMAVGLPAIGTEISGTEELIRPGRTGWLVPPRTPAALGAALVEAERQRERLPLLGAAARRLAEREFSLEAIVPRFLALYERLLNERQRSASRAHSSS